MRKRHPELIRSEVEKKRKKEKEKEACLQRELRRPLIETRNNLTNFPHKNMPIQLKNLGTVTIRELKPKIREGLVAPETLVRYRDDAEWIELSEFLNDWMRRKATIKQIDYLKSLQRQHGIAAEIPLDISREEISTRIGALVPPRDYRARPEARSTLRCKRSSAWQRSVAVPRTDATLGDEQSNTQKAPTTGCRSFESH